MSTILQILFLIRPCVRGDFPKFLFLRVSEKFGYQSLEIIQKKTEFSNSQNFRENIQKKVWKFKFGKKFGYYSIMYIIFENFEKKYVNYVNYESFELKYVKFKINLSADVKAVYFKNP